MKKAGGFRAPSPGSAKPADAVAPAFDAERADAFINGAQVKAVEAPRPKRASSRRVSDTDQRQVAAEMTKQFVIRMTEDEYAELVNRFKSSKYRYLHHYVRALVFPE